jgi:uncharacterized RDD family membrane protein YckC
MSKSRKPDSNRAPSLPEKLRPAPARWQKILLAIAALMLVSWLIVLAVLAML